ncbi:hypothetical protein C7E18_04815 [Stenotrophomonas maltophilia]|nr:hypothetical protein C7E18_04815 [Stenotrophomonas maltophilia]
MADRASYKTVSLDFDQMAAIKARLKQLHALTDVLSEGDMSNVDPASLQVLGDYAGMAVIAIDEVVSKAEDQANV